MADIINYYHVWESHIEVASSRQMGTDRHSPREVCQVTEDEQSPVGSPETESLEDIIRKLLPTPSWPPLEAAPIPSDQDLLIQRLMGAIRPSQPVVQERSKLIALEIMLLNWLPVGTVTEEDAASPDSLEGTNVRHWMSRFRYCLRDGKRTTSETSSSWDRGLRCPRASRWETPTDPGRGVGRPDQQ